MEFIAFGSPIPDDLPLTKAMCDHVAQARNDLERIGGSVTALLSGFAALERRVIALEDKLTIAD